MAEIFRRDIRFLDLGGSDRNREVLHCLSDISRTLATNRVRGTVFRVFRADQRAIGEVMIGPDSEPGNRWCRGYAEFIAELATSEAFASWTAPLLEHADNEAKNPSEATERLTRLQHQLIHLIDLLDPKGTRFPAAERTLIPSSTQVTPLPPY